MHRCGSPTSTQQDSIEMSSLRNRGLPLAASLDHGGFLALVYTFLCCFHLCPPLFAPAPGGRVKSPVVLLLTGFFGVTTLVKWK